MQLGDGEKPKPGDVLILDADHRIVCEHTIVDYGEGEPERTTAWGTVIAGGEEVEVLWRIDDLDLFEQVDDIVAGADYDADAIQELVCNTLGNPRQVTVGRPLAGDDSGEVPWLVLKPMRVVIDDDESRQTWDGPATVKLEDHSAAVAARARSLAEHLSLADTEVAALELAGLHHDDGKQDRRFQVVLGAKAGRPALAKSGGASSRRAQLAKARSGLPTGWRHEQLSVVLAQRALANDDRDQCDLVLRLVGTSHGRGRSAFPHGADQLIDPHDRTLKTLARDLFDHGGWEELIEATHRRIGPWACAYLEALLRAADCTVSKEGS
jgi:CRISPR-associated endonuclease/helicase Cas3